MSARSGHRFLRSAARLLLSKHGIKHGEVKPTGPKSKLLKDDAVEQVEPAKPEPVVHEEEGQANIEATAAAANKWVFKEMDTRKKKEKWIHPVFQ